MQRQLYSFPLAFTITPAALNIKSCLYFVFGCQVESASALESSVRRHGREIVFYMDTVVLPESVQAAAELRGSAVSRRALSAGSCEVTLMACVI